MQGFFDVQSHRSTPVANHHIGDTASRQVDKAIDDSVGQPHALTIPIHITAVQGTVEETGANGVAMNCGSHVANRHHAVTTYVGHTLMGSTCHPMLDAVLLLHASRLKLLTCLSCSGNQKRHCG